MPQPDGDDPPSAQADYPFDPAGDVIRYELSSIPRVAVGAEPSGPASNLFRVRTAQLLGDGRLVVAEPTRVLMFGPEGDFELSFGGEGQGPGEFRGILWMQRLTGDTLALYDGTLGRVSW